MTYKFIQPVINGKSVVAERFIRTLNNETYKHMTSISKNVYINKLNDILNKYKNAYHNTIKMKTVDVISSTYIDSSKEIDDKNPKFKVGDIVKICLCYKHTLIKYFQLKSQTLFFCPLLHSTLWKYSTSWRSCFRKE